MKLKFWSLIILLFYGIVAAQETPPIINYSSSTYNAENQNWDVTQDDNKFIHVANNEGLLQFNGVDWTLYKSPNQTIPRSVLAVDERIYYGAFMEFGYFEKHKGRGQLKYTSISKKITEHLLEDENIWHIKEFNGYILFQSYDRIYFYNPNDHSVEFITDKNNYYRLFKTSNNIYVFKRDGKLVRIVNGKEEFLAEFDEEIDVQFVLELYEDNNELILLTRNRGFFKVEGDKIVSWYENISNEVSGLKIFCGIRLRNKSWVLGTISNGLVFIDAKGSISLNIDIKKGLSNNTVLNLFEDIEGNLWVALDNGIDCINLQSFILEYNDFDGVIGTVYASIIHKENLYLGTNQGLFFRPFKSSVPFSIVEGTQGQVWSLFEFEGDLLCGHTDGTFLIEGTKSTVVSETYGTWGFRSIPNFENTLLIGNYLGMGVLRKVNDEWVDNGQIKGFSNSARFFEIMDDLTVYVNHEYKGLFKLQLDKNLSQFTKVEDIGDVINGKGSGLIKVDESVLYKNKTGTYKIENDKLIKNKELSDFTSRNSYLSGKIIADDSERLWGFNQNELVYAQKGPVNDDYVVKTIPIENSNKKTTVSFENISQIGESEYIVGRTNGYMLMDLSEIEIPEPTIFLNEIKNGTTDSLNLFIPKGEDEFGFSNNTFQFKFSVPNFGKYSTVEYQYRLSGLNDQWSNWSKNADVTFEKLGYGDYNFDVRARINGEVSSNIESFDFRVNPPYYLSKTAFFLYFLGLILFMIITHSSYKAHYRKLHDKTLSDNQKQLELERVKNEQELIKIKNQKLNQDIEAKNREVAISMMSIVKRNEILKSLKKELDKNDTISKKDPIHSLIQENLDSHKDWELFKTAFDQADVDFLKRAKERHPELTANDLKFCAYLRLNLSSKEIAPLLNISVKSVEVRRYRLRKKMQLKHKTNLTDYVLSI